MNATSLEPDLEYVGFWIRLVASLVDSILLSLLIAPVGYLLSGTIGLEGSTATSDPLSLLVSTVLPAIIVVVFWRARQSTPGKMMFGARIIDAETGADPRTRQWVLRYLGYYVSAVVFCLGFIWVAFDPRKQGWHDKIAGTVVVRARPTRVDPLGIVR